MQCRDFGFLIINLQQLNGRKVDAEDTIANVVVAAQEDKMWSRRLW